MPSPLLNPEPQEPLAVPRESSVLPAQGRNSAAAETADHDASQTAAMTRHIAEARVPVLASGRRPVAAARHPLVRALRIAVYEVRAEFQALGEAVARAYMQLLLLWDLWLGVLFMAGTWLLPQVGASGTVAVVTAYVLGRVAGIRRETWGTLPYLANPLLVGLGVGAVLGPSWPGALLIAILSALTFALTVGMCQAFSNWFRLPCLTLPAALVIVLAYQAAPYFILPAEPSARSWTWFNDWPPIPAGSVGFLNSLGAVLFVPRPAMGLLFAGLLLVRSRILFGLACGGYFLGVGVLQTLLQLTPQMNWPGGEYNFPLVAMALGGLFFVPSWRSYGVAAMGVCVTAGILFLAATGWTVLGLSPFFLPFNLVTLGFLYMLGLVGFSQIPRITGGTPEETLQIDLALRWRLEREWRTLRLPFFGRWTVWQACDGPWTHQGAWKHAYDFVITDERGSTFSGSGLSLKDYYCYRRPVVSPVRGTVVKSVSDIPDNEPGQLNSAQNWGNHVVLHDDRGFYVQLSHLAAGSPRVSDGMRVEPGTLLGQCGNSGFSPQPHLHIQVQSSGECDAATVPFRLTGYLQEEMYESSGLPIAGARVEPVTTDPQLEAKFEFLLGDELVYEVVVPGQSPRELKLVVRVAPDGTLYFETPRGARLYFAKHSGLFLFYRVEGVDPDLSRLLLALPRLPLVSRDGLQWHDTLPASLALSGPWRAAIQFGGSFVPGIDRMSCRLRTVAAGTVQCELLSRWLGVRRTSQIELDGRKGPARIVMEDCVLTRQNALDPH